MPRAQCSLHPRLEGPPSCWSGGQVPTCPWALEGPVKGQVVAGGGAVAMPAVGQTVCCPQEEAFPSIPDRLFKIVLVGNSAVGKTSFLRRFCEDRFAPGLAATVGEFSATVGEFSAPLGRGGCVKGAQEGTGGLAGVAMGPGW